jgi:CubicO group peptidase (beta-lactamase class C family)
LIDQPGIGFQYGHSTDLLGLLLARIEDAPLGDILKRRIFDPLGMKDTGFTVPQEKRDRRVGMYGFNEAGHLIKRLTATGHSTLPERPEDMKYESGGGGLWSTLDDYLAFARIFVGAGAGDGVRLLRPETHVLMTSNHLTESQRGGARLLSSGHGFGLGWLLCSILRRLIRSYVVAASVRWVGRVHGAAGGRPIPTITPY